MNIKELKRLIAELPTELDDKPLWYLEVNGAGMDKKLVVSEDPEQGVTITGDGP